MNERLRDAVGWRHGIVASLQHAPFLAADLPVASVAALHDPEARGSVSGGAARTFAEAESAAIGEALERYAAQVTRLDVRRRSEVPVGEQCWPVSDWTLYSDEQRATPGFPHAAVYGADAPLTRMYRLDDNRPVWVPAALVALDGSWGHVATSSGLAAGPTVEQALLRAVQELVERDAFMVTWSHGLPGRRVKLGADHEAPVRARGGDVFAFDLTPAYSPHPVAMVAGSLPLAGRPRYSAGLACRATWAEAVEKAYLEWAQGVVFAGMFAARNPGLRLAPREVADFDLHAAYYTLVPDAWPGLPLWNGGDAPPPVSGPDDLRSLVAGLAARGVQCCYRDLTTCDVAECGVRVVRVLSPQLVPIHADHRWPFIGGTAGDVGLRYPGAVGLTSFPTPFPHPLG